MTRMLSYQQIDGLQQALTIAEISLTNAKKSIQASAHVVMQLQKTIDELKNQHQSLNSSIDSIDKTIDPNTDNTTPPSQSDLQITSDDTVDQKQSELDVTTSATELVQLEMLTELLTTFLSDQMIIGGKGVFDKVYAQHVYKNDITQVATSVLMNFPTGFYINSKTLSPQLYYRALGVYFFIIDNIDTKPSLSVYTPRKGFKDTDPLDSFIQELDLSDLATYEKMIKILYEELMNHVTLKRDSF